MASRGQDPIEEALALEEKVLRHNDVDAMIDLGNLLLSNPKFSSQRDRGVQMLQRAIKQNQHPQAMSDLAGYLFESADAKQHRVAVSLLERSLSLREDPATANSLGVCFADGKGVSQDFHRATQLFERALRLDKESPVLMSNLAESMLLAPNLRSHTKRALALIKRAIHLSADAKLMNKLGEFYHYGTLNLSPCVRRAYKWYLRAIRASKLPSARHNMAILLLDDEPSGDDVHLAIQLLEAAVEEQQQKNVDAVLDLAFAYSNYDVNHQRALELYEMAAIRFNSKFARTELRRIWFADLDGCTFDHTRIIKHCWNDFQKNGNFAAFEILGVMIWTGACRVPMQRKGAIRFLHRHRSWSSHDYYSLMLRYDPDYHPDGEVYARELLNKFNESIDRTNFTWIEAVILSESDCQRDRLLAMEHFKGQVEQLVTWLGVSLRRGKVQLPFDGHLECLTNPVRKFAYVNHVNSLNLASILLETEGKQQEAEAVLKDLMDSGLRMIAMLNLAYVLLNGAGGVAQDYIRGMQLLEDTVKETNDVSARAMLANALSERADSTISDIERGWKLWRDVEEEEKDELEIRNIRRLVSTTSEEKWRSLNFQQQQDRMETCLSEQKEEQGTSILDFRSLQ